MNTPIVIPEFATIDEGEALMKDARAQGAGAETIYAIMDQIDVVKDRLAKIAGTENFKPTQAKLYFRRASEAEILAAVPDDDVFDDIALQEIKRTATGNQRIVTSEEELKDYKGLKAAGVTDIIYDKQSKKVVAKPVESAADSSGDDEKSDESSSEDKGSEQESTDDV